jgi:gamma-glutamyltranspeptidase/glutathione hydrolase
MTISPKTIARPILVLLTAVLPLSAETMVAPEHARHAMVASVQIDASRAGTEVMKQGGNAVDAAVATGFALAVTHPDAGNLGGGGFMLVRMANGETHFIDYREKAPAKATRDMYLDAQGNIIPDASLVGYKASGVPGSVAGMVYAEKHFGKLTLPQVMAPAIRLAREGFVLSYEDAEGFQDKNLAKFPVSRRIFQRDGKFYQPGDKFRQPELAKTL